MDMEVHVAWQMWAALPEFNSYQERDIMRSLHQKKDAKKVVMPCQRCKAEKPITSADCALLGARGTYVQQSTSQRTKCRD